MRNPPPFLQIRKKYAGQLSIIHFSSSPSSFSSLANATPTPVMKAAPGVPWEKRRQQGFSIAIAAARVECLPLPLCLLPCPNCHCCGRRRTMVSLAYLSVDPSPHLVVVRRSSFDVIFSLLFLCLWKFRKREGNKETHAHEM